MPMPKIIDCHVHHLDDSQVDWARELGYYKICLMDWRPDVLAERMAKHPDFVVGLGWLPMWPDNIAGALKAADEFKAIGCRGYKICAAGAAYDDERFTPIWEKAQSYGMPCFFHTGWLDLRLVSTDYYPVRGRLLQRWYDVFGLDRIALDFPKLKLTAFHMGNTRPADCAVLMTNHPNVYADTCRRLDEFLWAAIGGKEHGYPVLAKMVVGTDGMGTLEKHRVAMQHLRQWLAMAGASRALQERVFYKTALRILGMDDELKKTLVVRKGNAVELDGVIGGSAMKGAVTDFVDGMGEPSERQTAAYVTYDEQSLHMTVVCRDEQSDQLAITRDGPVGAIWQDDSIEVFLSPTRNEDYYHIGVNAIGRAYLQRRRGTASELPAVVKSRIAPGVWAVQMSIPFSSIGGAPSAGSKWGLNICRNKTTGSKGHFTWMEIASTYHDPTSFGYVVFE